MIDRGTITRGFIALLLLAAICSMLYAVLSDTDGTSGNFLEDEDRGYAYGPIFEDADAYQGRLLADPWIRSLPVKGGTFGSKVTRQVRIGIDGSGPIPTREVTLETPAAIALFGGPRRERAVDVLHGIMHVLEDNGGLVRGISLTEDEGSAQAAAIASIVRRRVTDGVTEAGDRRIVRQIIQEETADQVDHAFAWYNGQFQDVVLGPEISRGLLTWIRTPEQVTKEQGIFTAYVLRHELEHAVSPSTFREGRERTWIEEGTADVMARWPGAAAETARELGIPYPKRYEEDEYATDRGGYPEWTDTMRVLLGEAGVDWKDPTQYDEAAELVQEVQATDVPRVLAQRIARRNRMSEGDRAKLERDIRGLDGDPKAARRLVARL